MSLTIQETNASKNHVSFQEENVFCLKSAWFLLFFFKRIKELKVVIQIIYKMSFDWG